MSSLTLNEEKEKIEFEKKLERENIYREKLILGLILLIFSLWGSKLIEDFKSDQVREQFLTAKRLEAITEIRDSYIEVNKTVALQKGFLKKNLPQRREEKNGEMVKLKKIRSTKLKTDWDIDKRKFFGSFS